MTSTPPPTPSTPAQRHRLTLVAGELAVCRLPPDAAIPSSIFAGSGFVSVTRTDDELSIVCAARDAPSDPGADDVKVAAGYGALKVLGPLPFDAIGVIARLSAPLAAAGISILAIATYDTDYILIREADVDTAISALRADGHIID
jgi:hypothetical protein